MDILELVWKVIVDIEGLIYALLQLAWQWWLLLAWLAWWTFGVDWKKAWAFLGRGAWAPLLLLMVLTALVWSRVAPGSCDCLGFATIPNFWSQLGDICLVVVLTFMCGWIQGYFGWSPAEISLEPPAHTEGGHHH